MGRGADTEAPAVESTLPAGPLSDLILECYVADELTPEVNAAVEARAKSCDATRRRIDDLMAFNARWAADGLRSLDAALRPADSKRNQPASQRDTELDRSAAPRQSSPARRTWLPALMPLAAVLLVGTLLLVPRSLDQAPGLHELPMTSAPIHADERGATVTAVADTRVKGFEAIGLDVYIHDGERSRIAQPGERVAPGDRVGFRLIAGLPGHVAVAGVDDERNTYACYPLDDSGPAAAVPAAPVAIEPDHAMRLDALLGREHMIAVHCARAFDLADFRSALAEHGPDAFADSPFATSAVCRVHSFELNKHAAPTSPRASDAEAP